MGLRVLGKGLGEGEQKVGGHGTGEGFVRSDVIELGLEVTEGSLLSSHVGSGWPGGTAFEHEVHVLVLSVLLGAGGLDEIGHDAELHEPDGEPGEAAEGVGGEGRTVVCADPLGEPESTEEAPEHWDNAIDADVDAPAAVEQVAVVGPGQPRPR